MATPITIDIETITKWAGLVAAFFTVVGLIIRFLTKYIRTDRQETATTNADISIYKRLQEEIVRLEKIIVTQQGHLELTDKQFDLFRDLEMDGASDLGQLTIVLTHMPCNGCVNPQDSIHQLVDIVERMNKRRLERQKIIKGELPAGHANV